MTNYNDASPYNINLIKYKLLKPIIRSEKNFLHNPTYSTLCCVGLRPYFGRQVDDTYLKLDQFLDGINT